MGKRVGPEVGAEPEFEGIGKLPGLKELVEWRLEHEMPMTRAPSALPVELSLRRQLEPYQGRSSHGWIGISQLGKCARGLGFKRVETIPSERTIDARGKLTFNHGDLTEWILSAILDEALESSAYPLRLAHWNPQRKVSIEVAGEQINGYADGELQLYHSKAWKTVSTTEVKSVNQWIFQEWESAGGIGPKDAYWWQAQGYMQAIGVRWCGFLAQCKNSQALHFEWIPYMLDQRINGKSKYVWGDLLVSHIKDAATNQHLARRRLPTLDELGPIESYYQRAGKVKGVAYAKGDPKPDHMTLPWQCVYCDSPTACWEGVEGKKLVTTVTRDYRGKPKKVMRVVDPV